MGENLKGSGDLWHYPWNTPPGDPDGSFDATTEPVTIVDGSIGTWDKDPQQPGTYYPQGSSSSNATDKYVFQCVLHNDDGCYRWIYEKFHRDNVPGPWGSAIESGFAM